MIQGKLKMIYSILNLNYKKKKSEDWLNSLTLIIIVNNLNQLMLIKNSRMRYQIVNYHFLRSNNI